ncbi:hypothetical protein VTK26DRAFT_6428 [Humicola hyalothermophila]
MPSSSPSPSPSVSALFPTTAAAAATARPRTHSTTSRPPSPLSPSPSPLRPSDTLPHPHLRAAALLAFLPSLPLCIAHGALSHDLVPALGLLPLSVSAAVSAGLAVRGRREGWRGGRAGKGKGSDSSATGRGLGSARVWGRGVDVEEGEEEEQEGGVEREEERVGGLIGRGGGLGLETNVEGGDGEGDGDGDGVQPGSEGAGQSVLTHRIVVFGVDVGLAAALMVVLVFTWIGTQRRSDRPELAMLAAYATVPLLTNFLIHLYLAARELVAGLAIPELVEWSAWRAVPADCPHCGSRLRPDALPPIPWYESVSAPKVSLPRVKAPSIGRPSLPSFKVPRFSFKNPREWKVPNWMRGRSQEYARLFVDDEHNDGQPYRDDPEGGFAGPSGTTTVVATGSAAPVEEVVVSKKDKKGKSSSGLGLFGGDDAAWA